MSAIPLLILLLITTHAIRSYWMEYDIHTVLDLLTLAATIWVVYTMRFTPLKNTYQKDQDTIKVYYVVREPACLAVGLCAASAYMSPTDAHL
jgi:ER lumen protein retaining receptor